VAIVAWESPSAGLSDYLMEELTGALVDRDMEVADRQNLEYVYQELKFQMSGELSDENARSRPLPTRKLPSKPPHTEKAERPCLTPPEPSLTGA
jgi:hypothetical protein